MTLSRVQTVITYRSFGGSEEYFFDVLIDAQGLVSVKNVRSNTGAPCTTGLPDVVLDDMQEAKDLAILLVGETEAASGTIIWTGETEKTVALVPGVLNNTEYRVAYNPPDDIIIRTEDKTTTSFKAVASAAYGSGADPKSVPYSVLVATAQASTTGGTVTFTVADNSQVLVTFVEPLPTDAYRVLLSPEGFFSVRVINPTKTGFTIELGHTLQGAETVDVGYDVFV